MRILFIGNSYTSRNQLPRLVADLAAAAEDPQRVDFEMIVAGGASLKRHWNAGRAQEALQSNAWDYVVLQEQSTLPLKNPQRYHDNVRLFAPLIAERRAQAVLYLTWSRQAAPQTQEAITRAVYDIAEEIGAFVVPAGPAWHRALHAVAGLQLYESDGSHPTLEGSYLAAWMFHVALFGERPIGDSVADALKLDRALARSLQEIAWACRSLVRTRPRAEELSGAGG
ncbi:MAG TPA: hypothetical protein VLQ46_08130 [Casimicrobiaceae bacterium]|nr:hypothetical protein [Casimicrobiaceae bacterium]